MGHFDVQVLSSDPVWSDVVRCGPMWSDVVNSYRLLVKRELL